MSAAAGFGSKRSGGAAHMTAKDVLAATAPPAKAKSKHAPAAAAAIKPPMGGSRGAQLQQMAASAQRSAEKSRKPASSSPARAGPSPLLSKLGGSSFGASTSAPRSSVSALSSLPSPAVSDARLAIQLQEEHDREFRLQQLEQAAARATEDALRAADLADKKERDARTREEIKGGDSAAARFDAVTGRSPFYGGPHPSSATVRYGGAMGSSTFSSLSPSIRLSGSGSRPMHQTSILSSFGRSFGSSSLPPSFSTRNFTGMRNVGNSCYMNAVLQALLGLPTFQQDLVQTTLGDVRVKPPVKRPLADDSCFVSLRNLALQRGQQDRNSAIDTKAIKQSFGDRNRRFSGYQQQDAHEFLSECLNFIHDDVERCLLTDQEIRTKDEIRRKFESPPPKAKQKPAAASKPAMGSAAAAGSAKDAFKFEGSDDDNDDDEMYALQDRPQIAALAAAASPSAASSSPALAASSSAAASSAAAPASSSSAAASSPVASAAAASERKSPSAAVPVSPTADDSDDDVEILASPEPEESENEGEKKDMDEDAVMRGADASTAASSSAAAAAASAGAASAAASDSPAVAAASSSPSPNAVSMSAERQQELSRDLAALCPVLRNFHCEMEIELTCDSCGKQRTVHEAFHDFSVDLPAKKVQPKPLAAAAAASSSSPARPPVPLSAVLNGNKENQAQATALIPINVFTDAAANPSAPSSAASPSPVAKNALSELRSPPDLQLTQLVKEFFEPRQIEYKCECGKGTTLTQHSRLSKLPRVLILHLKRFQPNYARGTYEKRTDIVKFHPVIDLSKFITDDAQVPEEAGEAAANGGPSKNLAAQFDAVSPSPAAGSKRKEPSSPSSSRASSPAAARASKAARPSPMSESDVESDDDELKKAIALSAQEAKSALSPAQKLAQEEDAQLAEAIAASLAEPATPARNSVSPARASAVPRVLHKYELLSVVIHKGVTAGSGHYVSHLLETEKPPSDKSKELFSSTKPKTGETAPLKNGAGSSAAAASSSSSPSAAAAAPLKRVWKEYDDSVVTKLDDVKSRHAAESEGYIFFYAYKPETQTTRNNTQTRKDKAASTSAAANGAASKPKKK